ncbi:ICOS ligand-like [Engraulis encrasicolus]|uniref:ICOS ligand-like n=1 Tax=Engraulis encrasicolus TaxID=184585 RepID=UPI002FCF8867
MLVNATLGTCVLLQCILPHHPTLPNTRVYWQTKPSDGKAVHLYFDGKEDLDHQDPLYRNRTALDLSQLAAGNFSLRLCHLTEQDNNTSFYCLHATTANRSPTKISQVTLQLQEPKDSEPPWPWWTWVILVLAIFLFVLLALGIFYLVRRWRRSGTGHIGHIDNDPGAANGIPTGVANELANGPVKRRGDDSSAALVDNKEAVDLEMVAGDPLLEDRSQDG